MSWDIEANMDGLLNDGWVWYVLQCIVSVHSQWWESVGWHGLISPHLHPTRVTSLCQGESMTMTTFKALFGSFLGKVVPFWNGMIYSISEWICVQSTNSTMYPMLEPWTGSKEPLSKHLETHAKTCSIYWSILYECTYSILCHLWEIMYPLRQNPKHY